MKKLSTLILILLPFFGFAQNCPTCTITLPESLTEDTIFMEVVPLATIGEYYEQSVSFRLPKTTNAVAQNDSTIPPNITIDAISIAHISGMPAGLTWTANQDNYLLPEETDGCITICGTPFESGDFEMDVTLKAQISILSQTASLVLPMTVMPSTSMTEGFTITNNEGCGSLETVFQNNIPSNDIEGFSYTWDFGNGLSSTLENPSMQIYDEPGTYYINYEATVDTTGFLLTQITVKTAACDDTPIPFVSDGTPELYVRVLDVDGNWLHESDYIMDMAPPVTFDLNIELFPNESYTLQIWDEDAGIDGTDDLCGEININTESTSLLNNGDVSAQLTILHPVTTITSMDSVIVHALPEAPIVTPTQLNNLCQGERIILNIENYTEGIQWYHDEMIVSSDIELEVTETGSYWAEYTDENGCSTLSDAWEVAFTALPNQPTFTNTNNVLSLFESVVLPEFYGLQWYMDGILLEGETSNSICAQESGQYTLTVTDLVTGCSNTFFSNIIINVNYDCTVGLENINSLEVNVFPNPFDNQLQIQTKEPIQQIRIWNNNGQVVLEQSQLNSNIITVKTNALQAGFYVLEIRTDKNSEFLKVVKN